MPKKAKSTGTKKQPQRKRKTPFLLLAGAVAALIVAGALAGVFSDRARSPETGEEAVDRFLHIYGLEIAPWAPDDLFIGTHMGLVRLDGQGKWRFLGRYRHDFMGFAVNPTEEGVFYSSGHPDPQSRLPNPLGFMVSRDAGLTWQATALDGRADFHAMAVWQAGGDVIYGWNVGQDPGLYRSLNGGRSWEQVPAEGLAQAGGVIALAVHPEDQNRLLAGTPSGLLHSPDGGLTWQALLPGVQVTAVRYFPGNAERILIYAMGPDGGELLLSKDGGASWTALDLPRPGETVTHIAIHPASEGVMYLGTAADNLFVTDDGGRTWRQLAEGGVPAGT